MAVEEPRWAGRHGGGAGEAYIDALAATGVGMVCVLARNGRILVFDEGCERATGFSAAEVLGRDARECVIPPEEAEDFETFLDEVWRRGASSPQVGHWLTREGERRLISWSNRPIVDDDGEVIRLFTVGIDLTERERANQELLAVHEELARRLSDLEQLATEQSGLRRVSLLVAGESPPAVVFDAVAENVAGVLDAESAAVARFEDGTATFVGRWNERPPLFPEPSQISLADDSAVSRVFSTGSAARVERYDEIDSEVARRMRGEGYSCAAAAPVSLSGRPWGAVVVAATDVARLPPGTTERRLAAFAEVVSLALATADAREQVLASRKRLVQVTDEERRRLGRDLHDGAQQRLVAISQRLHLAQRALEGNSGAAHEHLDLCAAEVREAIEDLRRLANGLHPPILTSAGLRPALAALVRRSPLPVTLGDFPEGRFSAEIETAVYYLVSEALTNTAKHAQATTASVDVRRGPGRLLVSVADDGRGGASPEKGSGLRGLIDRVEALGGSLTVTSTGRGTTVGAELPLES